MSVSDIHQGDVVDISGADSDGKAKRIQKSDKVWTNDAVTNFSVDKDKSVLEIGNSSYRLGERTILTASRRRISWLLSGLIRT